MKRYSLINTASGWLVFIISSFVYLATMEPTASFWDCGEFIATAFKLEVGHPPGAPLFMLIGRLFTLLAGNDLERVAVMVNAMSALVSAFTILFLFWTITHLARKIFGNPDVPSISQTISIIGSGIVGALAYTFSDTFWFSAVEGEVYAFSSLFTAVVFWAILKWENVADEKYANRWLILIAYLVGLSIGVHLLNLLAIPAIGMVYYYRKYNATTKGAVTAFLISSAILGIIMYGVIPGVFKIASIFERIFVNGFGLPFKSGVVVYAVLLIGAVVWGIRYTLAKGKVLANTALLVFTFILIGYSSYSVIVIRSIANPPLDENDPQDMFSLISYLNREQYGDRPLVYGHYYNAPVTSSKEGKPTFTQIDGKYEVTSRKPEYQYDKRFLTLFPRMYSNEPNHVNAYKNWANIKGVPITVDGQQGPEKIYKPTMAENLRFFFRYQVGYMYFRYFMWNFAGRQNDIQGNFKYEITKGNWISGIPAIDDARLGPQDKLPGSLKSNAANNKYYLLPLLLGLVGLYFHYKRHNKDFWVVLLLFFFTGLAIVIYLNQTPLQPRERDYAYAGSFYAFAIWIGLGVLAIIHTLQKIKVPATAAGIVATLLCTAAVPGLMASENWDDHNRSGRYTARDFAMNYLNSCGPNAILFTNGDNDTFPLWYVQEVENIRTDVRVVNLSYLGADWYIHQMQRKVYDSDPIPSSLTFDKYIQGTRDVVYLFDRIKNPIDLKQAMDFLGSENPETKRLQGVQERVDYIPAKAFRIPADSATLAKNNYLSPALLAKADDKLEWTINRNHLLKNHMMVLDILANNNWQRPVYFAITVSSDNYMNLDPYFVSHGLAYLVTPVKNANQSPAERSTIDTETMYDNIMNKFRWGNIQDPDVYLDENNMRMLSNFRNSFSRLAEALVEEGKADSARKVLNRCEEVMPHSRVPYNFYMLPMVDTYLALGDTTKALEISNILYDSTLDDANFYLNLPAKYAEGYDFERRVAMYTIQQLATVARQYGLGELQAKTEQAFQQLIMSSGLQPGQ